METSNRVSVKIFGQEYTIVGDRPAAEIAKVAEYVDAGMREISGGSLGAPLGPLAVLTAVNIAEETFQLRQDLEVLKSRSEKMEQDAQKYVTLWEETKKNFIQYKEQAQASDAAGAAAARELEAQKEENRRLQKQLEEQRAAFCQLEQTAAKAEELRSDRDVQKEENRALRKKIEELESASASLQKKFDSLKERFGSQEEAGESNKAELKNLEEKCREIESNYFDLQMENIQLRGELDRYKKIVEAE